VQAQSTLARLMRASGDHGLMIMGAFHPGRIQRLDLNDGTLVLLGCGPEFWQLFRTSPEAMDDAADPIDRWSRRVVSDLGTLFDATPIFPFGGPPYAPFIDWAKGTGRAHPSPTGMLVHDTMGLMISYRGAMHFSDALPLPDWSDGHPCLTCPERTCTTTCPVGALSATQPYDVAACHAYLDTAAGQDCMENGCAARRACPLSAGARRTPEQSALHMKAFHPQ
jgi:hypothetical protein